MRQDMDSMYSRCGKVKEVILMLAVVAASVVVLGLFQPAGAVETEPACDIPEQVQAEHWCCKELRELCSIYQAAEKLSDKPLVSRRELARTLLSVLEKVVEKYEKEGASAIPPADLERIAKLEAALRKELTEFSGYLERRETIEKMLAKPEEPPFEYKLGMNGFLRGEGAGNFQLKDFSYAPGHTEGRLVYRLKPYVYWHPTDYLDFHVEGQGYGYAREKDIDNSHYSLYQGFLEAKLPGREWLAVKGGRQEFSYGSTFILGPNAFKDGLVFDGGRVRIKPFDPLTIDLLGGAYARPFSLGFTGDLFGVYATYAISEGNAVDAYFFRDTGAVSHHSGEELFVWGLRGTAKLGPVSLEFEPVYESGAAFSGIKNSNDGISAYGGHLDISYERAVAGYNTKGFFSFALGSGSGDSANGVSSAREFRNPDNNISQVGDIGVIGDLSGITVNGHRASGLQIYTLGWGIDFTKELNLSATGHYSVANNVEANFSRDIGLETDFTLTYKFSDDISVIVGYDHLFAGRFIRDASGNGGDIDYGYCMLQFDISRSWLKKRPAKL
jgi:hypothetical protein